MGFLSSISDLFRRPVVTGGVFEPVTVQTVLGQTPAELYATQPHLQTVVSFRARNVAQLKLQVFERVSDTDRRRVTDSPIAWLLKRPNPQMTTYELFERLVTDLDLYDVAYWLVVEDVESVSGWRIQPLLPSSVVNTKSSTAFAVDTYVVADEATGRLVEVPAEKMLVFHGYSPSSLVSGVSKVQALKEVLAEQIEAWSFRRQMWQRGGRVGSYIWRPKDAGAWTGDDKKAFKADWREYAGRKGSRSGQTPVLEDGMELRETRFSAREQEWAETTKLSLQTVASVYHVNPVMVGILDNANFANTKEFRKMLYSETLGPLLEMIQDRVTTFLLPLVDPDLAGKGYLEFNISAKLAGDFEEQASVLSTLVGRPILSLDEGRAKLNYSAVEGGDTIITPLNVVEGGQASPQDGGDPAVPKAVADVVAAWFSRQQRSNASKQAAGQPVDWSRWERELQADLVVKAGVDQFDAGQLAKKLVYAAQNAES